MDNTENMDQECNDTCDTCECEVEPMESSDMNEFTFTPDALEGVMVVEPADEGG